jgi:hypothetical protein
MARRVLQPLQFGDLNLEKDISGGMGSIEAHHPDHGLVGQIYWNTDPAYRSEPVGGVTRLDVGKQFQGQGLAMHLFQQAQQFDPTVQHSKNLTADGKKFVSALKKRGI